MPTYVAFLRAINLGARRRFSPTEVRTAVEATGATGVETYLATGNVRLVSPMRSADRLADALEAAFAADRGFEVPTVVMRAAEVAEIAATGATYGHEGRHYVELLREAPDAELVAAIQAPRNEVVVRLVGRAVHLMSAPGTAFGVAGLLPAAQLRRLGVTTNRNLTVVREVARRWA